MPNKKSYGINVKCEGKLSLYHLPYLPFLKLKKTKVLFSFSLHHFRSSSFFKRSRTWETSSVSTYLENQERCWIGYST